MNVIGWIQLLLFSGLLLAITKPIGIYLYQVLDPDRAGRGTFLDPVLGPMERFIYKLMGVERKKEHHWISYAVAMFIFTVVTMLVTYFTLRFQDKLPWQARLNPQGLAGLPDHLAFNTAASFTTNTNWQSYMGESTMSYLSQMVALVSHNFFSAAVGICVAAALVRGIARDRSLTVGNFWRDLIRVHLYLLLPACVLYAVFLVSRESSRTFILTQLRWRSINQVPCHHSACNPDHRARAGCLSDSDQDARHQWRRILQCQCRSPV